MQNALFRFATAVGTLGAVIMVPVAAAAYDRGAPRGARKRPVQPAPPPLPVEPAAVTPVAPPPPPPPPPPPIVGGAPMLPTNTIVQNASAASNLTTLVELVTLAGLDTTLAGPGPFTVFAPPNEAFGALPPATITALKAPENKATLTKILTYHVVPGNLTFADLKAQITAGGGTATLTTVAGVPLTAQLFPIAAGGETLVLTGANGNKSYATILDVKQANGVVHVVNGVLSPN
ncbi:MAG: fasciclin domain-containing protein [Pseudomonadota bacterium]